VTAEQEGTRPRRRAMRLCGYDYAQPGMYFVTVCTAGRMALFGEIRDAQMWVNEAGRIVEAAWKELPGHYPCLVIDAFVVMPNHVHGIIILHKAEDKFGLVGAGSPRPVLVSTRPEVGGATWDNGSGGIERGAVTAPLPLGKVVAYFKYESAKRINAFRGTAGAPVWQRGYYDHIIRRGDSLDRVRRYIAENPARWAFDRENPQAVGPEPEDAWARP
jgi:putative transposase